MIKIKKPIAKLHKSETRLGLEVKKKTAKSNKIDLPGFAAFLKEVAELTKSNNHSEARLLIAKYFKFTKYVKIFTAINLLHELDGSMELDLQKYRESKLKEMYYHIQKKYGDDIKNKVYKAL